MAFPKFDPWSASSGAHSRAYRAHCAYEHDLSGTLGTLSTRPTAISVADRADGRSKVVRPDIGAWATWLPALIALGWSQRDVLSAVNRGWRTASPNGASQPTIRFATAQTIVIQDCSGLIYCELRVSDKDGYKHG